MDGEAPGARDAVEIARDAQLLSGLRAGDEQAFLTFVRAQHGALIRVALGYVRAPAVAEEVAQEAWAGFLESLPRFRPEAASVRTWLFRILVNCARARGRKERRTLPLSALAPLALHEDDDGPLVSPERFVSEGDAWAGHWSSPPRSFVLGDPAVSREARELLTEAIHGLPAMQRDVLLLRDVEGFAADEVCSALSISEANQRVLLHRARTKVRDFLEARLGTEG